MKHIIVPHAHVGLLYENGAFTRVLDPGRHALTRLFDSTLRNVVIVDLRERSTTIKGHTRSASTRTCSSRLAASSRRARSTRS